MNIITRRLANTLGRYYFS